MPFVPNQHIKPKRPVCLSTDHKPPGMLVIKEPGTWYCPVCGMATLLIPRITVFR